MTDQVATQGVAAEKVTTKSLWAEIAKVSANYSGLQWRTMAISVLLLAKGSKETTIREKLAAGGITWGSKIVTMATRFTDGCLTEEDQKAIFAMDTEAAVADVDRRLSEHRKAMGAKSMDEYYPICGHSVKGSDTDAMIKRVRDKRKANASKGKAEPETGDAPPPVAVAEPNTPAQSPMELVLGLVNDMTDIEFAEFCIAFDGYRALRTAPAPLKIAA